jgi:hypothetical protein
MVEEQSLLQDNYKEVEGKPSKMNEYAYTLLGTCRTHGAGDEAYFVAEQLELSHAAFRKTEFYSSVLNQILLELAEMVPSTARPGWDGYESLPVASETFNRALEFAASLPNSIPVPLVGAEPDGHVTFEWYQSPERTLSVSVSPEGDLHYAALVGPNSTYGTEIYCGRTPKIILDMIARIQPA